MTGRVVVVGWLQVNVDVYVERRPGPGESATALAAGRAVGGRGVDLARAARDAGAEVVLVGAVGDDDAGRWCADALAAAGIASRLEVVAHEPTGLGVTMSDDWGPSSSVAVPGANVSAGRHLDPEDVAPGDVVLIHADVPLLVPVAMKSAGRRARVVVVGSPVGVLPEAAVALADPFVVGERDAALLADVGLMPRSLCVTFGRAGAVWDGLRMDSGDLGSPALAPGGTEAFCGTLAAALAAGCDRPEALRAAVSAAGNVEDD